MKKGKKDYIILLSILLLLLLILKNSLTVKMNLIKAVELWLTSVFPSLFPMFILSNLLILYQFPNILANFIGKPFSKIFHTSPKGVFVFIMSMISGTPSSAFIIKDFTESGNISEKEANYLLTFTFFSNPLFLINMLSLLFPNNSKIVWKIILIHYVTNLIIGVVFRPKEKVVFQKENRKPIYISFGTALSGSIKKALDTLLLILGTICFYYMLANLFVLPNPMLNAVIKGFLELTQGLNYLNSLNISLILKEILAISFISFGGLSIHTQIKSILEDTSISYYPFLKARILHVILSIFFLLIF